MSRVYLLDMGSLCAWKFYAAPQEADGMIHGLREWFYAFCEAQQPTHIACCFDAGRSFRRELNPEYKIARRTKPKPPGYIEQLNQAPALVGELGMCAVVADGFEADDLLATLSVQFASSECEVIVVSSDKDAFALVNEQVKVFDPRPNGAGVCRYYDVAGVIEKMNVPPHRVPDLLAMVGDSADSIEGIAGIGSKRALTAIQQTKSMSELFRKAVDGTLTGLTEKSMKAIAEGRPIFEAAMRLVELRYDVPLTVTLDDLAWHGAREAA